jgi:hypothetical protein
LIDYGDPLDGSSVRTLTIGREALSGNSVAFHATLSNGRSGIYRADFQPPAPLLYAQRFTSVRDGTGKPYLARLRREVHQYKVRSEVRDVVTGLPVGDFPFNGVGQQIVPLPYLGGGPAEELAVLVGTSDTCCQLWMKDSSSGATLARYRVFNNKYKPLWLMPVPDVYSNGPLALAIIAVRESDSRTHLRLVNALSGGLLNSVPYSAGFTPVMGRALPDLDSDGSPEVAVLAIRDSDGRAVVEIRNVMGPGRMRRVWFSTGFEPMELEVGPDGDGNGIPELAVLGRRISDGRISIEMRNTLDAPAPRYLYCPPGHEPVTFELVDDSDGNGSPEWAVLMQRISDDRPVVQLRNASGPADPSTIEYLSEAFTARALQVVGDNDGSGGPDLAVIATRDLDDRYRAEVRNAGDGAMLGSFLFTP